MLNEHMHLNMITVYKYMHKNRKIVTKGSKSWDNVEKPFVNPYRTPLGDHFHKIHHQQGYVPQQVQKQGHLPAGHRHFFNIQPNDYRYSDISQQIKIFNHLPSIMENSPTEFHKVPKQFIKLLSLVEFISLATEVHPSAELISPS